MARYLAVIWRQKKRCPECDPTEDACEVGPYERMDCGCLWEDIIGEYDRLNVAAMVAARAAGRPGTKNGGKATGHWKVLDAGQDEEMVAWGDVPRPAKAQQGKS